MIWPTVSLLTYCVRFQCSSIYEHGQGHAALHSLKSVEKRLSLVLPLATIKVFQTGEQIRTQGKKIISDLKVVNGTDSQTSSTGFQEKYYTCTELL